ncbi:MAG: tRNA epoxyqueuosine(34) reductase QueG [Xanthomonadaceae bacterium]|nr:tRNA epoxyqueuosine(34) reductase QueG [Xanthomonadaceae bacterium]
MNPQWFNPLFDEIKKEGFPLYGIVDIDAAQSLYSEHFHHYQKWIEKGHAGEMRYLLRGLERRKDPRNVFGNAQSVLSVALPYSKTPHGEDSVESGVKYARYLRGRDYHDEMPERLERALQKFLETQNEEFRARFEYKICVDTSAILERTWASLSGLGWIGKNTLLIHPKYGSYLLLGEILISEKSGEAPKLHSNFCGSCTRCLTACPTSALQERELNSTRCISYWTLEKRGELNLSESDRSLIGNWVAGCDICQEVCPFNNKAKELVSSDQPAEWSVLERETIEEYKLRTSESALNRVKPEQFKRNLALIKSAQLKNLKP